MDEFVFCRRRVRAVRGLWNPDSRRRSGSSLTSSAVDAGSTDPGPAYLGSGKMAFPKAAVQRDLRLCCAVLAGSACRC